MPQVMRRQFACAFHSMAASGGASATGIVRHAPPALPARPAACWRRQASPAASPFSGFIGLLAPARLPPPIPDRTAALFRRIVADPRTQRCLLEIGTIPAWPGPTGFREDIRRALHGWEGIATELKLFQT